MGIFVLISAFIGYLPPSISIIIQPITLLFPVLMLLNFSFLVYWVFTINKYGLISLLIVVSTITTTLNTIQFSLPSANEKNEQDIKLLSYNVKNFDERNKPIDTIKSNRKEIISFIRNENADIICLQEYYSVDNNLYGPIKNIRDSLSMTSYYYESYFSPKHNQLLGLVTYSRYKAINKGKLKFKGSRTFGIYTDLLYGKDTIRVFNIHLASIKLLPSDIDFTNNGINSDADLNRYFNIYKKIVLAYKLRQKQLKELLKVIEATHYPALICGDFNDTPSSWVYKKIRTNFNDTFVKKGMGISSTYAGPLPFLRIDYILASPDFKIFKYQKESYSKSDHYPITSIVKLKQP